MRRWLVERFFVYNGNIASSSAGNSLRGTSSALSSLPASSSSSGDFEAKYQRSPSRRGALGRFSPRGPIEASAENESRKPPNLPEKLAC
jgi:hypothetical protein